MDAALIGLLAGSGWSAGISLYGATLALGLFGRFGPGGVPEVFTRTDTLVIVAILFALEFIADKVPVLDSVWDAAHTLIRPAGAAVLALLLTGEASSAQQALAAVGSGGLALSAHATKATTRLAINSSPEPISNAGVSFLEEGLVAAVVWFAITNPLVALVLVVVLVVAGTVVTVLLFKAARRAVDRWRQRRRQRRRGGALSERHSGGASLPDRGGGDRSPDRDGGDDPPVSRRRRALPPG